MDVYSLKELAATSAPYALSPIPGPKTRSPTSWITKLLGVREVSDLGILTTYLGAAADRPLVHRTWGLLGGPSSYGPNFRFSEYMKVQNYLTAIFLHFSLAVASFFVAIPFLRKLAKRFVTQPGDGPTKEQSRNDRVEYRGIGNPDVQTPNPGRAFCKAYYEGSLYECKLFSLE
jgi:hypothetical protein